MTTTDTITDELISHRLRSAGFAHWRGQVDALRGCAAPIHLRGSSHVLDRDGAVLIAREGTVLAPCGNRREAVCPACSDRYAADAYHLLRAGLAGDDTKHVPTTVAEHPRVFLTLTAPSFGPVHTRATTPRGNVVPCGCGERHHPDDPRIGTARDPESYDYVGAVLWQAHAGALWSRFTTTLRRALASALGVPAIDFKEYARLSYAKVAEYQRRGLVHFHAVIRLDGPHGPTTPPPALGPGALRAAIVQATRTTALTVARPGGEVLTVEWGRQLDIRPVTPSARRQVEGEDGELTDAALAGYIAKYATKTTGTTGGADRPIRDIDHLQHADISPHHAAMIRTAWDLGALPAYEGLHLRRWAHMLAFRGHFLTKSRAYSTTFRALRAVRRIFRLRADLDALGAATDDPNDIPADPDSVTVVNDWWPVHFGHRDDAERELAAGIAERHRNTRRTTRTARPPTRRTS